MRLPRTKIVEIEWRDPLQDVENLAGYQVLKVLVRWQGTPVGYVDIPLQNQRCPADTLEQAIWAQQSPALRRGSLGQRLLTRQDANRGDSQLLVSIAVCTRNRPAELKLCLEGLKRLDYPNLDLLIIDNAPEDEATERLVRDFYPGFRYICEPRPGLNWARNRAISEARGDIIAYTDDDVVVDQGWVRALARIFGTDQQVMAVTGLVAPYELETEAQLLFEQYGGFGRGFERKWVRVDPKSGFHRFYQGTGQFGTGANMAYRRSLFDKIGRFDPALDVGTPTNGGGDLEMFFRVLKEGYTLVYEPAALVRHRHRRDYSQLRSQLRNNGIGFYAYLVRSALAYPEERHALLLLGVWWLWWWNIRRWLLSLVQPLPVPRDLIQAEVWGSLLGLTRYQKSRRSVAPVLELAQERKALPMRLSPLAPAKAPHAIAVRTVNLAQPLPTLMDVTDYARTRIFLTWNDRLVGRIDIANKGETISPIRLQAAIAALPDLNLPLEEPVLALAQEVIPERLSSEIPVSIVVATYDRPDDLRRCLHCLRAQQTSRRVEIVVVDNHPASGLTPPVIAEFPGVVLVNEFRQGLAYARNAGFLASSGEIAVATDDDVIAPPDWLEKLVAPFARPEVMIVTGNTLPLELESEAQCLFEQYGGLGRGFERKEVGLEWFRSFRFQAVPTWRLGATANAAFRTSMFNHPQIGLMDEALGPGMPSGVGEDTYLFYKVLRAGFSLVYEPNAYVWHKHRREMAALRNQIYGYSKGHIAYHLTTFLRDRDWRALWHIMALMPPWRILQAAQLIMEKAQGKESSYSLKLLLTEIKGNIVGPWALWRSRQRVKREGQSRAYPPGSPSLVTQKSQVEITTQPL